VVFATTADICGFVLDLVCRLLSFLQKQRNHLERHKQQVLEFYVLVWRDLRFRRYALIDSESRKNSYLKVYSYPRPVFLTYEYNPSAYPQVSKVLTYINVVISKPTPYSAFSTNYIVI
jgi:hypothetical protein